MTESLGFTTRQARDDEWRRLKADGEKGVCRHSTHMPQEKVDTANGEIKIIWPILYVVTWSTPKPVTVGEEK